MTAPTLVVDLDDPSSPTASGICMDCGSEDTHLICDECFIEPRDCIRCGNLFEHRVYRHWTAICIECRASCKNRECEECLTTFSTSFHEDATKCRTCRLPLFDCADCGITFHGHQNRRVRICPTCRYRRKNITCLDCGVTFGSTLPKPHIRCTICRKGSRLCAVCNEWFFTGKSRREWYCVACRSLSISDISTDADGATVWRFTNGVSTRIPPKDRDCSKCRHRFAEHGCAPNGFPISLCPKCRLKRHLKRIANSRRSSRDGSARRQQREIDAGVHGGVPTIADKRRLSLYPCAYCGEQSAHADHIRAISRGGWDHLLLNMVGACRTCNLRKHNLLLIEWRDVAQVMYGVRNDIRIAQQYVREFAEDNGYDMAWWIPTMEPIRTDLTLTERFFPVSCIGDVPPKVSRGLSVWKHKQKQQGLSCTTAALKLTTPTQCVSNPKRDPDGSYGADF